MEISDKIEQWKQLKQSKKALDKRLAELRQDIIPFVMESPQHGVVALVRNLTSFKEDAVHNVMHFRNIGIDEYTKHVIDESKVEQLYYSGAITDDDLRSIRDPKYIYALVEVGEDNIQE